MTEDRLLEIERIVGNQSAYVVQGFEELIEEVRRLRFQLNRALDRVRELEVRVGEGRE